MRNIKLTIEYDGTNYFGWQIQAQNVPTIQAAIKSELQDFIGGKITLQGASRTDAGVHAISQVASFRTEVPVPLIGLQRKLNSALAPDIVIKLVEEVPDSFNPVRGAKEKIYLYKILNRSFPSAIHSRFSWFVYSNLDLGLMHKAALYFEGSHDFSSFMARDSGVRNTVRDVFSINIVRNMDFIEIEVTGDGFLRHMVRIIVGTLIDVGKGRIYPSDIPLIIDACNRCRAGITAPPQGLFLKNIRY